MAVSSPDQVGGPVNYLDRLNLARWHGLQVTVDPGRSRITRLSKKQRAKREERRRRRAKRAGRHV